MRKKIHQPNKGIYGICLRGKAGWGENILTLSSMLNSNGGTWFDNEWIPMINTPEWKTTFSNYVLLLQKYGPPDADQNGYLENLNLFSQGNCGIWIDATIAAASLFDPTKSNVSQHLGISASPTGRSKQSSNTFWTWAFAIPTTSRQAEKAANFIRWATSKQYIELVAEKEGWLAIPAGTRKSTYDNVRYQQAASFSRQVLHALQEATRLEITVNKRPYSGLQSVGIAEFPAIGNQVGLNLQRVLNDEISIDLALERSQKLVFELMAKAGYYRDDKDLGAINE